MPPRLPVSGIDGGRAVLVYWALNLFNCNLSGRRIIVDTKPIGQGEETQ